VERNNRIVIEVTRCLFHDKGLPKIVWVEVVNTTIFLLNRLPTKPLQKRTPLRFSYIPQVKRDKLDKKAEPEIFVGYKSNSKAYRI
jgi:hypothetical protein